MTKVYDKIENCGMEKTNKNFMTWNKNGKKKKGGC